MTYTRFKYFVSACILSFFSGSYAAELNLSNGVEVNLSADVSATSVHVDAGTTLSGDGVVNGDLIIGGTISPGTGDTGVLGVQGNALFLQGSTYLCSLNGSQPSDLIECVGTMGGEGTISPEVLAPGAVLRQTIFVGLPGSDHDQFSLSPANLSFFRLETSSTELFLSDTTTDSDQDGSPDYNELVAGTDSGDSQSFFHLRSVQMGNQLHLLTLQTIPGRIYDVLHGPEVGDTGFGSALASPVTATTNTLQLLVVATNSPNVFFMGTVLEP